jgi:hypothetical protein
VGSACAKWTLELVLGLFFCCEDIITAVTYQSCAV